MTKVVPDDLYYFLCLLMFGKNPDSVHAEPDLNRRVLAVAQDIVYCASNSRCKTPKHVILAVSVKHLTGSKQVIKMFNSLGHSLIQ